jgi:hypothetical protein
VEERQGQSHAPDAFSGNDQQRPSWPSHASGNVVTSGVSASVSDDWSEYHRSLLRPFLRGLAGWAPVLRPPPAGSEVLWRWSFRVLDSAGHTVSYVRANASNEDEARAVASLKIDRDRTLGEGTPYRPAAAV